MIRQPVTKEFVLRQLEKLPPERLQEVSQFIEFLQFQAGQAVRKPQPVKKHSAFGMWANRPEAQDPIVFAAKLRKNIETRQDETNAKARPTPPTD